MTKGKAYATIKDTRLFPRPFPDPKVACLSSLPVQLRNGTLDGSFPEEKDHKADAETKKFLMEPVDSHKSCGYVNGEWKCNHIDEEQPQSHKVQGSRNRVEEESKRLTRGVNKAGVEMTTCSQDGDDVSGLRNTAFNPFSCDYDQSTSAVNKGLGAGLSNLGNTCYANSTLQCLQVVPELKLALSSVSDTIKSNGVNQASYNLTLATHHTFCELDQDVGPVTPHQFIQALHERYPKFAEDNNGYEQQDAEECWLGLLDTFSETLTPKASESEASPMKELFGIDIVRRVQYKESGENFLETPISYFSLKCTISQDVNHLREGIENFLKLLSEDQDPYYTRDSRIDSLPRYLTVMFNRSTWNEVSKTTEKNLRKVDYPVELDVYEFCSAELKQRLKAPRQMLRDPENAAFGLEVHEKASSSKVNEWLSSSNVESSSMDIDKVGPSLPMEKLTGIYDLVAVITHSGPTVKTGHYIGWVKQDDGKWAEFDDASVTVHQEEKILKLCGGGNADDHIAYICLYKARIAE